MKDSGGVLITGGSGYLAQHLIRHFISTGHFVASTASHTCDSERAKPLLRLGYTYRGESSDLPAMENVWSGPLELEDAESVQRVATAFRPTTIVHAAAFSSPRGCEQDPERAMATNCPHTLLEGFRAAGLSDTTLLVFLSTDQVFSGDARTPYREEDEPGPLNIYGKSKLAFENLLRSPPPRNTSGGGQAASGGGGGWPNHVILRSSNIIGGPSRYVPQPKFLDWLDDKLKTADEPVTVFEDEVRSFVYVKDICRAVTAIALRWESLRSGQAGSQLLWRETYHMGGPDHLSRVGLAQKVCEARDYSLVLEDGRPRIAPCLRSSMDLGFTSPLNISMDSTKLASAGLDFPCTPIDHALDAIFSCKDADWSNGSSETSSSSAFLTNSESSSSTS